MYVNQPLNVLYTLWWHIEAKCYKLWHCLDTSWPNCICRTVFRSMPLTMPFEWCGHMHAFIHILLTITYCCSVWRECLSLSQRSPGKRQKYTLDRSRVHLSFACMYTFILKNLLANATLGFLMHILLFWIPSTVL